MKKQMDLDSFQEEIGGISKYQVVVIFAVSSIAFFQGFSSQAPVFINALPSFRCAIPEINDLSRNCNLTEGKINNLTIPDGEKHFSCKKIVVNWTECASNCDLSCLPNGTERHTTTCENGYDFDSNVYGITSASEFNLVCNRRYLNTLSNTLFFFGFFVGSLFVGPLTDWFGRKRALLILASGLMVSSIACAFSPIFELFALFRFFVGTFVITLYIAAFTYVNEISNTKWRIETATLINVMSASSRLFMPGIAYLTRNWRHFQLTIGFFPAYVLILYFFIPETPRWLLANGKQKEARKVLSRFAKSKRRVLSDETWKLIKSGHAKVLKSKENTTQANKKIRVWDLFRRPLMRMLCFNVIFSWFTVSMVFYGLVLNAGNLAGNPYLNILLNAVVEVIALACIYFADWFGRRPMLIIGCIMAGISCITSMLCSLFANGNTTMLTASTVLAIAGKFFASNAYGVIYSVTSEIFPTNARATGVSLGSVAARVGNMCAPILLEIQRSIPWFTQTVFGSLTILAGLLSIIYPETSNTELLTTMDEAEDYYRENMTIFKRFRKRNMRNRTCDEVFGTSGLFHGSKLAYGAECPQNDSMDDKDPMEKLMNADIL